MGEVKREPGALHRERVPRKRSEALQQLEDQLSEQEPRPMAGKVPRTVPKLYRAVVLALAGRIVQCGLTMQECDETSGVQDGYTAKMLHPDTASGRVAGWEMLQLLMDALYPHGVEVVLVPRAPGSYDPAAFPRPDKATIRFLSAIASGNLAPPANDDGVRTDGASNEQDRLRRDMKAYLEVSTNRGQPKKGARMEALADRLNVSPALLSRFKTGAILPDAVAGRLRTFLDKADARDCQGSLLDDLRDRLQEIIQESPAALGILAREAGLVPQVLSSFATGSRLSPDAAELVRHALQAAGGTPHDPSVHPRIASATMPAKGVTTSETVELANDDTPASARRDG